MYVFKDLLYNPSWWTDFPSEKPDMLSVSRDINSTHTSNGHRTYDPLLQILENGRSLVTRQHEPHPPGIFCLQKRQLNLEMEYRLTYFGRICPVFTFVSRLVGDELLSNLQPICHSWNVTSFSLLYPYFYVKSSV